MRKEMIRKELYYFNMDTKKITSNTFNGGLITDSLPIITPKDVLTDCINGTLITHKGNEYSLQNDLGNIDTGASLKPGFIPMGMKEYNGIMYIVSYNPDEKLTEIGTYPSPGVVSFEKDPEEFLGLNIDLEDKEEYDYEYLKQFECEGIWTINSNQYFGIVQTETPDIFDIKYKIQSDEYENQIEKIYSTKNDLNKQTYNYELSSKESTITYKLHINKIEDNSKFNLYKSSGKIYGKVHINAIPDDQFKSSKIISTDVYINDEFIENVELDDKFENVILINNIPYSETTNIKLIHKINTIINNVEKKVYYSKVYSINVEDEYNIKVFDKYFYWIINSSDVSIFFDINDPIDQISNIVECSIQKIIPEDTILYEDIFVGHATYSNDKYQINIPFNNAFEEDHIYVFTVKTAFNEYSRLLITSKLFNKYIDFSKNTLDFSNIKASEWVSNLVLDDVNSSQSEFEYDYQIIGNKGYPYREYKSGISLTNSSNKELQQLKINHNEFVAKFLPYININSDASLYTPSVALRKVWKSKLTDIKPLNKTGIWNTYYGDINVSGLIDQTFEYYTEKGFTTTFDVVADKLTISKRNYTKSDPKFWEININHIDERTSDTTMFENIFTEYITLNDNYGNSKRYLVTINNSSGETVKTISASLLKDSTCITSNNSLLLTFDHISEESELFDLSTIIPNELFEKYTYYNDTIIYSDLLNNTNALFIPVHFISNNSNLELSIGENLVQRTECYAIMCITKDVNNKFTTSLVKFQINSGASAYFLEVNEENRNKIISVIDFYNSHLYTKEHSTELDVYKLIAKDIHEFSNSKNDTNELDAKITIKSLDINGVKSDSLKDKFVNIPIHNLDFEKGIEISYKIRIADINYTEVLNEEEILDELYNEFSIFINSLKNKKINDTVNNISLDVTELLYDDEYNIYPIANSDLLLGGDSILNSLKTSGNKLYIDNMCNLILNYSQVYPNMKISYASNKILQYSDLMLNNPKSLYYIIGSFEEYLKLFNYENT